MLFIRQGSVRHIGRSVNIRSDIVAMFYSVFASNNGASAEVYNFGATPTNILTSYEPDNRYYAFPIRCLNV